MILISVKDLLHLALLLTTDQSCSKRLTLGEYEGKDRAHDGARLRSRFGNVTTAGEPFLGSGYTALHFDMKGRLMKEDAIGPEIHVGAFSSENPVNAILNLFLAVPVHRLKPGHFKRQVALCLIVINRLLEIMSPSNL